MMMIVTLRSNYSDDDHHHDDCVGLTAISLVILVNMAMPVVIMLVIKLCCILFEYLWVAVEPK